MRYKAGEHVRVNDNPPWFGQVIKLLPSGRYLVRIGGTETTKEIDEPHLSSIIPNRTVAPTVFPPVAYLEGMITLPQLAYPFTNEPGFNDGNFHAALQGKVDEGAVVGVSGAVLDVARWNPTRCMQIVSLDINKDTVECIDLLRKLLVVLDSAGQPTLCKRAFRLPHAVTRMNMSTCEFLREMFKQRLWLDLSLNSKVDADHAMLDPNLTSLEWFEFRDERQGNRVIEILRTLQPLCKGKTNCSSWFEDDTLCSVLPPLIKIGRFDILCGDIQSASVLQSLRQALLCPVAVFHLSNALDYMRNSHALITMFGTLARTTHAKVVTSSQVDDLTELLGTFKLPKVHEWSDFLALLENPIVQKHIGTLLEGMKK